MRPLAEIDHHLAKGTGARDQTRVSALSKLMNTDPVIASESNNNRYEAVVRMTEALSTSHEPEKLAPTLADEIGGSLQFDHLYLLVLKENSTEIEYLVWGKNPIPVPELPIEELPTWDAMASGETQHTADWETEERYPRFKPWAKKLGLGSSVRVPLTTTHRRLGVFEIIRDTVNPFSDEEISLLRLIGRVVAFELDDGLSLRRAQQQNDRLQLLLDLTNRITSNLQLREVLRAIAASVREVMQCDVVAVSLLQPASGKSKLYALDFPQGKGFLREDRVHTLSTRSKRVLETLQPAIVDKFDPADFSPEIYDQVVAEGLKSTCLIPLVTRGRALGLLTIARTTESSFTPDDVQFLTQVAGQIAIAIENALHTTRFQNSKTSLLKRSSISKKKSAAK